MRRFLLSLPPWTLTIIVLAAITYLTLVPHPLPDNDIELFPGADKLVHAIMFGALAGAACLDGARRRGRQALTLRYLVICFIATALTGGAVELLQGAMNMGRSCDIWDFVADSTGALIAVIISRPAARFLL